MTPTMSDTARTALLERLEHATPVQAKANLKNLEQPWRERIGRAIQRALAIAGVTQKEAAGLLDRDQAQVARWIAGAERPQMDTLFAVEMLRQPLIVALAELAGAGVEVTTAITMRRIA